LRSKIFKSIRIYLYKTTHNDKNVQFYTFNLDLVQYNTVLYSQNGKWARDSVD